jgi:predicted AlkP superfamily pyrophosphatase or phosphodiesterase
VSTNRALILLFSLLILACASTQHISIEYGELIGPNPNPTSKRTVILFLVDGMGLQICTDEINGGKLPSIENFFIGSKKEFYKARTVFPSLTFPAIASLLTESQVDKHGIYGNIIVKDHENLDFQVPSNFKLLNKFISGHNIFSRLKAKGLKTVSIDYAFNSDSDIHIALNDVEAGNAYLNKNYFFIDSKLISNLSSLLRDTKPEVWPDFIFVHLIGVDAIAHDQGPTSPAVKKYLEKIDSELSSVFKIVDKVETAKKRQVVSLMTSDHGFDDQVTKVVKLEDVLEHREDIKFLDEGRFGSLYLPSSWSVNQKEVFMQSAAQSSYVDLVAYTNAGKVSVYPVSKDLTYPYFTSNLEHYFQAEGHPDAIIIPKPGYAFNSKYFGQHGGPTPQEIFVPLLMHNSTLSIKGQIPALWELLSFL